MLVLGMVFTNKYARECINMFTVKTSAILQALKPYESFATHEDVQKDVEEKKLKNLCERTLFFTEKPASYEVFYTTDKPVVEYVVILTIGGDSYVYAFNDYKQVDYCLEASATEIDLDEKFYLIVSPLYNTIALYDNSGFCCDELTIEQAIARRSK